MAKISLSKSGLQKERVQLKLYQKLLPSLELKRMQLMGELAKAKKEREKFKESAESAIKLIVGQIPMLANRDVNLSSFLKIRSIETVEQNIVGVRVPSLQKIEFETAAYSFLATPTWIDAALTSLKQAVEARVHLKIMELRIEKLTQALRRMTQRTNLFEKVLIPKSKKNIQKIQIALGDAERSAVVRSKLAKSHHLKQAESGR